MKGESSQEVSMHTPQASLAAASRGAGPFPYDIATERLERSYPVNGRRVFWVNGRRVLYADRLIVGKITRRVKPRFREIFPVGYVRLLEGIFTRPKFRYIYP